MNRRGFDRGALAAGVFFVIAGTLFLLDQLGVIRLHPSYLWPLLLIGLGVSILIGGRSPAGR